MSKIGKLVECGNRGRAEHASPHRAGLTVSNWLGPETYDDGRDTEAGGGRTVGLPALANFLAVDVHNDDAARQSSVDDPHNNVEQHFPRVSEPAVEHGRQHGQCVFHGLVEWGRW